jgi:Uma2 family endonuclease
MTMVLEHPSVVDDALHTVQAERRTVTLPMTRAQFLALPQTNLPTEYVNGVAIMSPTPIKRHQDTVQETTFTLRALFPKSLGSLNFAPLDVHIDGVNTVQPDVFWVSAENTRCNLGEDGYWYGAPDLVIEVLSPATEKRDRGEKFKLYETAGVREYWLIGKDYVEVYQRLEEKFARVGVFGAGESFATSLVADVTIDAGKLLGA